MAIATTTSTPTASDRAGALPTGGGYFVFYDAQCRLCARSRRTIERLKPTADVAFVDVQDPVAMEKFPAVDRAAGLRQMFVLDPAGRLAGGYDGFVALVPALRVL